MLQTATSEQNVQWLLRARPAEALLDIVEEMAASAGERMRRFRVSQRGSWLCVDVELAPEVEAVESAALFARFADLVAPFEARLQFFGSSSGGATIAVAISCRIE